jgi:hypothetical protein
MIGSRCIVILPDRDVDIGELAADEMIELSGVGAAVGARKVKRIPFTIGAELLRAPRDI